MISSLGHSEISRMIPVYLLMQNLVVILYLSANLTGIRGFFVVLFKYKY